MSNYSFCSVLVLLINLSFFSLSTTILNFHHRLRDIEYDGITSENGKNLYHNYGGVPGIEQDKWVKVWQEKLNQDPKVIGSEKISCESYYDDIFFELTPVLLYVDSNTQQKQCIISISCNTNYWPPEADDPIEIRIKFWEKSISVSDYFNCVFNLENNGNWELKSPDNVVTSNTPYFWNLYLGGSINIVPSSSSMGGSVTYTTFEYYTGHILNTGSFSTGVADDENVEFIRLCANSQLEWKGFVNWIGKSEELCLSKDAEKDCWEFEYKGECCDIGYNGIPKNCWGGEDSFRIEKRDTREGGSITYTTFEKGSGRVLDTGHIFGGKDYISSKDVSFIRLCANSLIEWRGFVNDGSDLCISKDAKNCESFPSWVHKGECCDIDYDGDPVAPNYCWGARESIRIENRPTYAGGSITYTTYEKVSLRILDTESLFGGKEYITSDDVSFIRLCANSLSEWRGLVNWVGKGQELCLSKDARKDCGSIPNEFKGECCDIGSDGYPVAPNYCWGGYSIRIEKGNSAISRGGPVVYQTYEGGSGNILDEGSFYDGKEYISSEKVLFIRLCNESADEWLGYVNWNGKSQQLCLSNQPEIFCIGVPSSFRGRCCDIGSDGSPRYPNYCWT